LTLVADVPLPGGATRFDYQEIDAVNGQLVIAHMNDDAVVVVSLSDGSLRAELTGIPTPRGVAVADEVGLIFVTSTPNHLVLIDSHNLTEVRRVTTGTAPDGDAWDPIDMIVGVSDQGDGALSLIADAGSGTRTQVPLGVETGNVVFDAARGQFWITVVTAVPPNQLVEIDPKTATVTTTIGVPGCDGAHGLRLHPDGKSAFIACEGNNVLARVDLDGTHAVTMAATGEGADVLSIDPASGWLYVAAESGDLTVFDINQPGTVLVGHDRPGDNAHTVAADPASHRVFFPLPKGVGATPVLRIMRPAVYRTGMRSPNTE
jgi:DNA-binding beta-propeller fold protein YncE